MACSHKTARMALESIARGDATQDQIAHKIRMRLAEMGGHSQAALARAMGVPPMWVSMRLNGTAQMTVNDMARFAEALGVEMGALLPSSARGRRTTDGESGSGLVAVGAYAHPDHPIVATAVSLPQQIRAPHPSGRPRSAPTGR